MTARLRLGVVLLCLVATVALTVWRLHPPADEEGIDGAYVEHVLGRVAAEPHPAGSDANDRVRRFLASELERLGYRVREQRGALPHWRFREQVVPIGNLVATLDGTGDAGRAFMLAAHFDSRDGGSHGAGDDAAGVAAVMEAARQLAADPPANDVVILLTDAEEAGLLGARLWAQETAPNFMGVSAVVNVEGRGSRGPSVLFETGRGDARLVDLFAESAPHPVASSLGPAVYRLMPNATDFTVFRFKPGDLPPAIERDLPALSINLPGLNFAFIGGYEQYHQSSDVPANLSRATLLHGAAQTAAVARRLGQADLATLRDGGDATFFDVLSLGVVRYPAAVALGGAGGGRGVGGRGRHQDRSGEASDGDSALGDGGGVGRRLAGRRDRVAQVVGLLLPHPRAGAWFGWVWFGIAATSAAPLAAMPARLRVRAALWVAGLFLLMACASTALLPGGGYLFSIAAGASGLALLTADRRRLWWVALPPLALATSLLAAARGMWGWRSCCRWRACRPHCSRSRRCSGCRPWPVIVGNWPRRLAPSASPSTH